MDKTVLKPNWSKILVFWLLMWVVVFLFTCLNVRDMFSDSWVWIVAVLYSLVVTGIFCVVFFNLPYWKIEISKTEMTGPSQWGLGWQRVQIPIEEIDLKQTSTTLGWLGIYVFQSKRGAKISVWCFNQKQIETLITLLSGASSVKVSSPGTA